MIELGRVIDALVSVGLSLVLVAGFVLVAFFACLVRQIAVIRRRSSSPGRGRGSDEYVFTELCRQGFTTEEAARAVAETRGADQRTRRE